MYLKLNQYEQALEELKEVEELEKTLYGEQSIQIAKTYKVIGTLHIINNNVGDARDYLLRSLYIFEQKGLLKLIKEVKNKLKLLNSSQKLNIADAALQEGLESGGDDSGKDYNNSPERKQGDKVSALLKGMKKNKKVAKKKPKKTVFRNNFIKDGGIGQSDSNQ